MNRISSDENIVNENSLGELLFAEAASLFMEDDDTIAELFSADEVEEIEQLKIEALRRKPRPYAVDDEWLDIAAEPSPEV